jgi:hypothetical protein
MAVPNGLALVASASSTRCRRFLPNSVAHSSLPSGLGATPFAVARRGSTGVIVPKSGET